jgi:nucleoid-associated protein YgaU
MWLPDEVSGDIGSPMSSKPSKLVALFAVLLGVWVVTYWLWEPKGSVATTKISFGTSPSEFSIPPAASIRESGATALGSSGAPLPPPGAGRGPSATAAVSEQTPPPAPHAAVPDNVRTVNVLIPPRFFDYTVQEGDRSLDHIARRLRSRVPGLTAEAIARANSFATPHRLIVGRTVLRIPLDPANIQGRVVAVPVGVGVGTAPQSGDVVSGLPESGRQGTAAAEQTGRSGTVEHVVQPGETLSDIAKKHYGRAALWRRIHEANRDVIQNPDQVRAGTRLRIPPG